MLRAIIATLVFLAGISAAGAQSYPVMVTPLGNGGYWLNTPGQPTVIVQPWAGGYSVGQVGQSPTIVQPFGNGYLVTPPPGQAIQPLPAFVPIPPIGGY